MSTINFENASSALQSSAKSAANQRFEVDAKATFDAIIKSGENIMKPIEETLKN